MRNKATKKNMDLDLRRYGRMLYTKAEESGSSGGGNTPSGDITIDDVVKFIHDTSEGEFPYTTWDDIPNIVDVGSGEVCKLYDMNPVGFEFTLLYIPPYTIGIKESLVPVG